MTNAVRGALWSGLVFPGLGQVVLRHYKRGLALILMVGLSVLILVVKAVRQAFVILQQMEAKGLGIDMSTISKTAAQASTQSDSLMYSVILWLILFLWIIAMIDAYRLGKKMDFENHSTSGASKHHWG